MVTNNCESFCSGVYGGWGGSHQVIRAGSIGLLVANPILGFFAWFVNEIVDSHRPGSTRVRSAEDRSNDEFEMSDTLWPYGV